MSHMRGHCTCGDIRFVTGAPVMRALCHCNICKAYHGRDFADFTVFRASAFDDHSTGHVTYDVKKQPPLLARGNCDSCAAPILERLNMPGLPKMMLIPTRWLADQDKVPAPSFHMFYNLRVQDADDDLPKASGYLPSQLLFARHFLPAVFSGKGKR